MTTATKVFAKRGVYHSELVRVTDPDGVVVTLKGEPVQGKSKDFLVWFECNDEEHYYQVENEDILSHFRAAPIGRPVTIHASGTRDSATVTIEGALPEPNEGASNHLGNPGRPVDGQQNAPEEQAPPAETGKRTLEDVYLRCLLTAHAAQKRFLEETGHPVTDEDIRIATTLLIQTKGR